MDDICKKRRLERMEIMKLKRKRRDEISNFSIGSSRPNSSLPSSAIALSKEDERKKRNRESAEKSRQKKIHQIDSLTFQVYELYSTYCDLVDENDRLRTIQYSELIQSCQFSNSSDVSDMSVDSDDGTQSLSNEYDLFPILANTTYTPNKNDNDNSNNELALMSEQLIYDYSDYDENVFMENDNDNNKHWNVMQSNSESIIQQELQLHDDFHILEELTLDELNQFLCELEMENSLKYFDS